LIADDDESLSSEMETDTDKSQNQYTEEEMDHGEAEAGGNSESDDEESYIIIGLNELNDPVEQGPFEIEEPSAPIILAPTDISNAKDSPLDEHLDKNLSSNVINSEPEKEPEDSSEDDSKGDDANELDWATASSVRKTGFLDKPQNTCQPQKDHEQNDAVFLRSVSPAASSLRSSFLADSNEMKGIGIGNNPALDTTTLNIKESSEPAHRAESSDAMEVLIPHRFLNLRI
jgi:hypothetical protein